MKKTIFTLLLVILTFSSVCSQKFNFKTSHINIESAVEVDGMNFYQYLVTKLQYPTESQRDQTVGIYIGRIRLDSKGQLIEVSTVNPISASIDEVFIKLINKTWKNHKISVKNISDTTDFIVPVKYIISSGGMQPAVEYFVNYDQKPECVPNEVIVVGINPGGAALQAEDMTLMNKANRLYNAGKYEESIDYLDMLINRNPYSEDLLYMRANAYMKLNNTIKACRDYQYLKYFLKSTKLKGLSQCE